MISLLILPALWSIAIAWDVSTGYADIHRPYDLPAHIFQPALDDPAATGDWGLIDFGPSNKTWDIKIAVASDVPLNEAQDEDGNGFGNNKVGQLTVLGLSAPDLDSQFEVTDDDDICIVVFRGFTNETNRDGIGDSGTCEMLSEECHNDLVTAGEERDGCVDIELPESCSEYFPEDIDSWGFGFQKDAISATGRFFGYISNAENKGSDEAKLEWERAVTHTWPVIFTWGNFTELRCLWAHSRSDADGLVTEAPDRDYSEGDGGNLAAGTMVNNKLVMIGTLFSVFALVLEPAGLSQDRQIEVVNG